MTHPFWSYGEPLNLSPDPPGGMAHLEWHTVPARIEIIQLVRVSLHAVVDHLHKAWHEILGSSLQENLAPAVFPDEPVPCQRMPIDVSTGGLNLATSCFAPTSSKL